MIDFSKVRGIAIPEGNVAKITDANGVVLWNACVKVTITSNFLGMNGDTARITVNSTMLFSPDATNPSYKTKTWTVSVSDEPNCTIEIPVNSTIECTVSRDKGNADSYISLNGTRVLTGEGTYLYTVTRRVEISIEDRYSQGDHGIITIIEKL